MKMRIALPTLCLVVLAFFSAFANAQGLPLSIDLTSIRAIQTYNVNPNATDDTYVLVTGVANGKECQDRVPKDKTLEAGEKHPAVTDKEPINLWKGQLDKGEFALFTVTLMQGKGQDQALIKKFVDELTHADQKVVERSKKTLTKADFDNLAKDALNADRGVIKNIKQTFSREKNTDHYSGQFTVILWNDNGKLTKRLDPVGLTFGEHYGNDIKIYSKLKNTRNNVLVQDNGQWAMQQMEPLNDDQNAVRVKMLETEYIKQPQGNPVRHVTDYLVEIQIKNNGKPETWELPDLAQVPGIDQIHAYWNWAQ